MACTRALTQLICRALIGVFLFAQLAVAGYACPDPAASNARAVEAVAAPCSAMPGGYEQMDRKAANLCAEHCKFGHQSSDAAPVPVVSAPSPTVLYLVPTDDESAATTGIQSSPDPLMSAAPPPHTLLHCVLRI